MNAIAIVPIEFVPLPSKFSSRAPSSPAVKIAWLITFEDRLHLGGILITCPFHHDAQGIGAIVVEGLAVSHYKSRLDGG